MVSSQQTGKINHPLTEHIITEVINEMGLSMEDLMHLPKLSPYLILDGHRTGIFDYEESRTRGYVEGAKFAIRFARILQEMGGKQATFLIHTLRNYKTQERIGNIFDAIGNISKKFIETSKYANIRLKFYGSKVHTSYSLADIINKAESQTKDCNNFNLNFLTNYSEHWGNNNFDLIAELPEISVIGRFTKGHYSGAGIPGHADKANFMYIQQASISKNWSDEEIMILILSLLKSHLALKGYVGSKKYSRNEREEIRYQRELELFDEQIILSTDPRKRITSFSPMGPITVLF